MLIKLYVHVCTVLILQNSWNEAYTALNAQFEQLKAVLMAKESELNLMKGEAAQSSAMAKVARDKFNEKINDFEEFVHVREELEAEVVRLRKKVAKVSRSDIKYEGNDRTAFLEDVNRSLEAKLCCSGMSVISCVRYYSV